MVSTRMARSSSPIACAAHFVRLSAKSTRSMRRSERSQRVAASVKADETAKRLMTIPGVGPVTASAIMATIQDASAFASGREFAAFLGLTPPELDRRQNTARAHHQDGRPLPAQAAGVGACATLGHRQSHSDALRLWASGMLERKTVKYKFKLTAVALANKVARIVFVLMTRGGQYDDGQLRPERTRLARGVVAARRAESRAPTK